jgi:hypothetical protein
LARINRHRTAARASIIDATPARSPQEDSVDAAALLADQLLRRTADIALGQRAGIGPRIERGIERVGRGDGKTRLHRVADAAGTLARARPGIAIHQARGEGLTLSLALAALALALAALALADRGLGTLRQTDRRALVSGLRARTADPGEQDENGEPMSQPILPMPMTRV